MFNTKFHFDSKLKAMVITEKLAIFGGSKSLVVKLNLLNLEKTE